MSFKVMNPTIPQTDEDVVNKIKKLTLEENPDVLFPSGYSTAFVGIYYDEEMEMHGVVYCENTIIELLMNEFRHDLEPGDDLYETAREFYHFNVKGSHFSTHPPVKFILT